MTFDEFKAAYTFAFKQMMKYTVKEVGSALWADRMAELADLYPEWAEAVEAGKVHRRHHSGHTARELNEAEDLMSSLPLPSARLLAEE